jgi:mono/diheme cytochrome c family protein
MGSVAKLIGLIILAVVLATAGIYTISDARLKPRIQVPVQAVSVRTDISAIQHGQHLAGAIALCTQCHGANMSGGIVVDDASARIVAPNLTRGHTSLSDSDLARAIRDGVGSYGRLLLLMPSQNYIRLSDTDLSALIGYIRALPGANNASPTTEIRALGRLRLAIDPAPLVPSLSIDPALPPLPAPEPGATAAYGEYLEMIAGCAGCHAPGLGRDLSEPDFLRVMRTGRRPEGGMLDPAMPWQYYAQMNDLELQAIWQFLQSR